MPNETNFTPAIAFLAIWALALFAVDLYFYLFAPPTISSSLKAIAQRYPDTALVIWVNLGLLAWHLTARVKP